MRGGVRTAPLLVRRSPELRTAPGRVPRGTFSGERPIVCFPSSVFRAAKARGTAESKAAIHAKNQKNRTRERGAWSLPSGVVFSSGERKPTRVALANCRMDVRDEDAALTGARVDASV